MTPTHTRTDRHGRHYKTADREILIETRRYPGETMLWAHVRPLGSKADFVQVDRDPHGGPGSLARVLADAQAFSLDSTAVLLATLETEALQPSRHTSGTHANGQYCVEACFDEE